MKNKQISLIFFLVIQLYIYVMLICFNNLFSEKILEYLSVCLCFILGISLFCKTKDYFIMLTALLFTLIGDTFMIFFDNLHIVGLICLNIVEILYFLRIYLDSEYKKLNILSRVISVVLVSAVAVLLLKDRLDIMAILWIIFFINLFLNILFTIKEIGLNNFFPIGLLLLFVYSICLLFLSLNDYLTSSVHAFEVLNELPFSLEWVFYLPAQVVLTCSIFTVNRRCYSKIKNESND